MGLPSRRTSDLQFLLNWDHGAILVPARPANFGARISRQLPGNSLNGQTPLLSAGEPAIARVDCASVSSGLDCAITTAAPFACPAFGSPGRFNDNPNHLGRDKGAGRMPALLSFSPGNWFPPARPTMIAGS